MSLSKPSLFLLSAVLPLAAHHSTRAEFDDSKVVTMTGTVSEVVWMNPHALLTLRAADAQGNETAWTIELPPPNALKRLGWQKDDVKTGDRVTLGVWVARNGETRATARSVTFPDGRTLTSLPSGWDNPITVR